MKHSFFLVIPRQQTNPQRLKELDEKILQQWISELPIANAGLAARLVYDFILEFNALVMPAQLRLDTLELLRPSLLTIEDYLRSRLVKLGFPKDDNDQKALRLLVALQRQFTIGYWIALKELTEHAVGWFQGKNAALSIQRSIMGLSNIVISYYIMGMPVPDWIWMDLHSLYKLSVKIKKNNTQVAANDVTQINKTSSPEESYLQIILLSLADPTGLMQKEIRLVYKFIATIRSLVSLKSEPIAKQATQCVILAGEDKPARFKTQIGSENQHDDGTEFASAILYIDFTRLYKAFDQGKILINATHARFSTIKSFENKGEKLTVELLDYLKQRWAGIELQSATLFNDRLDRYLAIGLTPTFKLQEQLDIAYEDNLEFLAHSVSSQLLSCVFKKTDILSVGSLVSFRKVDAPENVRTLGIVNKLVVEKESSKISFGMELLTEQSIPVTYLTREVASEHPKKALLYHPKQQKGKNYIIIDTFILKEDDVIRLFIHQEDFSIILKNKKNIGLGYWQFECMKITKTSI